MKTIIVKCFLVRKVQGLLKQYLQDQKYSEQNIDNFWLNHIWPKYLPPEQQTDAFRHKIKPPYITMWLLNRSIICKGTICLLSKDANKN